MNQCLDPNIARRRLPVKWSNFAWQADVRSFPWPLLRTSAATGPRVIELAPIAKRPGAYRARHFVSAPLSFPAPTPNCRKPISRRFQKPVAR